MSGRSAFWLLYFSLFLFLFTVIIITVFVSMQLRDFKQNSWLVFHSFTIFIPSFWFSGSTDSWEWDLGFC